MSTKSNRSAGTQHTQKGITQGVTLVDPKTGNPVNVIQDNQGIWRLAVDANITLESATVNVDLDGTGANGDNVYLVDNATGNKFKINSDGSIDSNVEIDALDGDNIAIKDPITGNTLKINSNGSIDNSLPSTPTIVNIPISNTEQSYSFPSGTRKFKIQTRNNSKLQVSFTAGQTNTNFYTIRPGNSYEESDIKTSSLVLYFRASNGSEVLEITSWS